MGPRLTRRHASLDGRTRERLLEGHASHVLTGRGHDRVLRIARTVADLDGRERIAPEDIEEALGYRLGAEAVAA